MSVLSLLLNIAWIVCGGLWMALGWIVAAVIMVVTIVGIPWAKAAFNIAVYTLLPFGQKAVSRADYSGQEDVGTGPLGVLGNIIWLVLAGGGLALGHVIVAGFFFAAGTWVSFFLGALQPAAHAPLAHGERVALAGAARSTR